MSLHWTGSSIQPVTATSVSGRFFLLWKRSYVLSGKSIKFFHEPLICFWNSYKKLWIAWNSTSFIIVQNYWQAMPSCIEGSFMQSRLRTPRVLKISWKPRLFMVWIPILFFQLLDGRLLSPTGISRGSLFAIRAKQIAHTVPPFPRPSYTAITRPERSAMYRSRQE